MAIKTKQIYSKNGKKWILRVNVENVQYKHYSNAIEFKAYFKSLGAKVIQRGEEFSAYYDECKFVLTFEQVAEPKRKSAKEQGLMRGNQKRKTPRTMKKALINNEYSSYTRYEIEQLKARIKRDIKKVRNRSQLLQSSVNIDKSYLNAQLKAELQQVNKGKMILKKLDDLKKSC